MRLKSVVLLLLACVLSIAPLIQSVAGVPVVHVSVIPNPVPAGGTFQVTYYVSPPGVKGNIVFDIQGSPPVNLILWNFGPQQITGGLDYEVTPPPINTPGSYVVYAEFLLSGQSLGNGVKANAPFQVVGAASVSTDWAVLSVSLNPPSPNVGDQVTFGMQMDALSSTGSFPQSVDVECTIDGATCGGGPLSYPGPTGLPATVTAQTPWTATPGTHTLTWSVSTAGDPNPNNNVMSTTFTVGSAGQTAAQTVVQTTTQAAVPFDFSVSVSPQQETVALGGNASYIVTVNLVSGTPQSVVLHLPGIPVGLHGNIVFKPHSGTPPFTSTLNIMITSSPSSGPFTWTLTGTGGGVTHATTFSMTVAQTPDFRIDVGTPSQTVLQGQTTSYTLSVVGLNGFSSQVSLAVSGLPAGANGVFSVPSATPNFTSTLTVTLPPNAPNGTYTLTVTGTGGGLSHVANLVLTVNAASMSETSTSSSTQTSSDLMSMIQQNQLLVLGGIVLIVAIAVAALMSRRKPTQTQPPSGAAPGMIYCRNCGTQNPTASEFCGKCGNKLH